MPIDTQLSISSDCKLFDYVSALQQIRDLSPGLSRDMLGTASSYQKLAEDFKKQAFPETRPGPEERIPNKYYLNEIKSNEGKVVLKEDYFLEIELSKENGLFFFQNDRFNIFGSGFTKEEALKDLSEFFVHDYLSYKETSGNALTQDARQLLDEYESIISTFIPT